MMINCFLDDWHHRGHSSILHDLFDLDIICFIKNESAGAYDNFHPCH